MYGKEFEDADYMRGLMRGLSNKLFSYDDIISDKVFSNIAKSVDRTKMKVGKVTTSKAGRWSGKPYTMLYRNKVSFNDTTYIQFTLSRKAITGNIKQPNVEGIQLSMVYHKAFAMRDFEYYLYSPTVVLDATLNTIDLAVAHAFNELMNGSNYHKVEIAVQRFKDDAQKCQQEFAADLS